MNHQTDHTHTQFGDLWILVLVQSFQTAQFGSPDQLLLAQVCTGMPVRCTYADVHGQAFWPHDIIIKREGLAGGLRVMFPLDTKNIRTK